MGVYARFTKETSDNEFADTLLHPVEYSFSVESPEALIVDCGLELVAPCINQFDDEPIYRFDEAVNMRNAR